jgi:predicted alpha/beta-hydrolase family hydrolase
MSGTVILSHGLESGPDASKVSAMAVAAEALGWRSLRPDYRDLDAANGLAGTRMRLQRLLDVCARQSGPLILAGSSFGAFISALASLQIEVRGLFLLALPLQLPGYDRALELAPVPTCVLHGWHDELIPARAVYDFCAPRSLQLHLVNDSHRLSDHVQYSADLLSGFLSGLPAR